MLIVCWLRANRISLNVDKTEIIIFRPKDKNITKKLNFRISGQQVHISKQVKYLVSLMLDEYLSWSSHISMLKAKLSRANGLLAKLRYCTSSKLLTTIRWVSHRCWEHGRGSTKFDREAWVNTWGEHGGLKMVLKNTCEWVHLLVKLIVISLQACKFTKNELLHIYFSRSLASF